MRPVWMQTKCLRPTQMDLEKALAALSPRARRIIELREYGYRYEEIANIVGSTEAAIKMQVKRAFEKMRDLLISLLIAFLLASFEEPYVMEPTPESSI